jgi:DNA-binding NarL/FixJ family response regulator
MPVSPDTPLHASHSTPAVRVRARLGIIHRNRIFRECLIAVLTREGLYEVREFDPRAIDGQFSNGHSPADVILVDAALADGQALEVIQRIRQQSASIKLLAVVSAACHERIVECISAGAHGCILEESSLEDLCSAIEAVRAGQLFCSEELVQAVLAQFAEIARESQVRKAVQATELSERELEILELIAGHLGNKQIARRLSVSVFTVKNHVHNILKKLELSSRFEAVDYARRRQWFTKRQDDSAATGNSHSPAARTRS